MKTEVAGHQKLVPPAWQKLVHTNRVVGAKTSPQRSFRRFDCSFYILANLIVQFQDKNAPTKLVVGAFSETSSKKH